MKKTEREIGRCITKYEEIAYEASRGSGFGGEECRYIYDLIMFCRAVFVTIKKDESLDTDKQALRYGEVEDLLKSSFLNLDEDKTLYTIGRCPSGMESFPYGTVFLQLCYIVFEIEIGSRDMASLFMKACYYNCISQKLTDKERSSLSLFQGTAWRAEIEKIFRKTAQPSRSIPLLKRYCDEIAMFLANDKTSNDPGPIHDRRRIS